MNPPRFDPAACHRAFGEKVAVLHGFQYGGRLDGRELFYLQLLHDTGLLQPGKHLVDLGAGTSAFGPVARALGMEVTIADDFGGGGGVELDNLDRTRRIINGWRHELGIRVLEIDLLNQPLALETASVDVVTSINSLEHWHHSPKRLFREIVRVLKPRGYLILVTPNAANLRKRFDAVIGRNIWDRLEWWYHDGDPVFRGHVREPVIADLKQMMLWNDIEPVAVYGRNFLGRCSKALEFIPPRLLSSGAMFANHFLQFFPSLCSDIHVIGRKRT